MFDALRPSKHVRRDPKEIKFLRKPDGSVDTTARVLLVFPIFTHMFPEAFGAFASMLLHAARNCMKASGYKDDYKFDVFTRGRALLHTAMNEAVDECIKNPWYVGLIAFDDDCLPPQNTVARLLAHFEHGQHAVAAYGFMRNYPHTTTLGRFSPHGQILHYDQTGGGHVKGFDWLDDVEALRPTADAHGMIDVDFCGMPAMFISRDALVKIQKPAFAHSDPTGAEMTHDVFFCTRLHDAGYTVKADLTLECAHIGPPPLITRETRDYARAAVEHAEAQRKAG